MAELVGAEGFALGTDSSPRFIEDARREAAEAGVDNVEFEAVDAQNTREDDYAEDGGGGPRFPQARRRLAQDLLAAQIREPVLGPDRGGGPALPLAPRGVRRRHLRPRAFLARPSETTSGIPEAAGFTEIELHRRDFDYFMGEDVDEAVDALLAIGAGAELIRLNGEHGESRRSEIADALAEHYSAWLRPDGSVVGRGSVWIVAATNPG